MLARGVRLKPVGGLTMTTRLIIMEAMVEAPLFKVAGGHPDDITYMMLLHLMDARRKKLKR